MKNSILKATVVTVIGLTGVFSAAHAAWPSDAPIEVIVGFAPGGSTDIMARILAPYIAKHLGNNASIVVVNRPGASGEISVSQVMRAKPDGYTIGVVNLPGYFFLPMYRKTSYTTQDLSLVARVVSDPSLMVTRKDGKLKDFQQVVTQLKKESLSLSAGHNGLGTNGHIAMVQLNNVAGVQLNAIPFSGTSQQKNALAGSTIDIAFVSASEVPDPEKEAIPMRVLAQFARTKAVNFPSVPTTFELGYAVEMTAERGFAAPKNLPNTIMTRLQKAVEAAMSDPEYIKTAKNDAPFLSYLGGAEWTKQIEKGRSAYEEIAKSLPKD
jgi:tripartite-type tricarboxylate transporter receptor subunit TctC